MIPELLIDRKATPTFSMQAESADSLRVQIRMTICSCMLKKQVGQLLTRKVASTAVYSGGGSTVYTKISGKPTLEHLVW